MSGRRRRREPFRPGNRAPNRRRASCRRTRQPVFHGYDSQSPSMKLLHLPYAHSSIRWLWLVRAALVPAKRITRAAWPDRPDAAIDSGPPPCGFGGPRDSR